MLLLEVQELNKLITIIGPSGIGKTALAQALAKSGKFATALEQHEERPFQTLLKEDARYGLANQIDYYLPYPEQERSLRAASRISPTVKITRRNSFSL